MQSDIILTDEQLAALKIFIDSKCNTDIVIDSYSVYVDPISYTAVLSINGLLILELAALKGILYDDTTR